MESAKPQWYRSAGEPAPLDSLSELKKKMNQLTLDRRSVFDADHHIGEDVFPNPRRREKVARSDLLHVSEHGGRAFRTIHRETHQDGLRIRENVVPQPSHRQIGHRL